MINKLNILNTVNQLNGDCGGAGYSPMSKDYGNAVILRIAVEKSTYIKSANPTFNYGLSDLLGVGHNISAGNYRSLLKFNNIPLFDNLNKVKVFISNRNNNGDNTALLQFFRIKRDWTKGTGNGNATGNGATWDTYDGVNNWEVQGGVGAEDYDNTILGQVEVPQNYGTGVNGGIDILINNIEGFVSANNDKGFLIKNASENSDFHSYYSETGLYPPYFYVDGTMNGKDSPLFKKTQTPLIEYNSAFGSIVYVEDNHYAFFFPNLGHLIFRTDSTDGKNWGSTTVVLNVEVGRKLEVCSAWKEGNNWYMLYRSNEWNDLERSIGLATSNDGFVWTKYVNNPVIKASDVSWATSGRIDPWGLIKVGNIYYLWINDVDVVPRKTGLYTSTDLINWTANPNNPIFDHGRYCVSPFKYNNKYYLLVPYTPLGNVSGADPWAYRIELYRCDNPIFLSADREYLGNILLGGEDGEWDDDYLDTPMILTKTIYKDTFPFKNKLYMYYTGHNGLSSSTGWAHGLAVGDIAILDKLTAIPEPAAGE
jgi:hypothetical protein